MSVRGNNCANFSGAQYIYKGQASGSTFNLSGKSWSVSCWLYPKTITSGGCISFGAGNSSYTNLSLGYGVNYAGVYSISDIQSQARTIAYTGDVNTWVHIVYIYNAITLERSIYRNGIKEILVDAKANGQCTLISDIFIGVTK